MYEHELFEEGKAEGMQQGREQERNEIFERLVKQGLLSKEEVKKQLALMK